MDVRDFLSGLARLRVDFFTGVPDSLLRPLNDTLLCDFGLTGAHVVAADEGGAVGLAAGHFIATGRPAMVYLQNSGLGNAVNPICSLLHGRVYGIPCVFVVGWRGEPGVADEPQHAFQGAITREMLELMEITVFELNAATDAAAFSAMLAKAAPVLAVGGSVAFLVRKSGLTGGAKAKPESRYPMAREEALRMLLTAMGPREYVVATTGKTSREIYELREELGQGHSHDFLTVGSMGHANMIALGMAKARPKDVFWCLDGDGAALMHLGGLAIEAQQGCRNLIHVLLNNGAHESVGGMPVAGGGLRFAPLARALGYEAVFTACDREELAAALADVCVAAGTQPCFLEIMLAQGSRADLGRPAQTPRENLRALSDALQGEAQARCRR
ncbi:MAG: phosphonopyruvate decarboxylase [Eubacteriales bacterium]|nr:phosphonopyruvate decarboxylase [Eubacteriales bacterium]